MPAPSASPSAEEVAGTEQADEANHDQVQGNDEIEQTRHQQNQDTGNQGEQRGEGNVQIQGGLQYSDKN